MNLVRFCRVLIKVDQQAGEENSSVNADQKAKSKKKNRDQNTRVSPYEEGDKTNDDDDEKQEEEGVHLLDSKLFEGRKKFKMVEFVQ